MHVNWWKWVRLNCCCCWLSSKCCSSPSSAVLLSHSRMLIRKPKKSLHQKRNLFLNIEFIYSTNVHLCCWWVARWPAEGVLGWALSQFHFENKYLLQFSLLSSTDTCVCAHHCVGMSLLVTVQNVNNLCAFLLLSLRSVSFGCEALISFSFPLNVFIAESRRRRLTCSFCVARNPVIIHCIHLKRWLFQFTSSLFGFGHVVRSVSLFELH